MGKTYILQPSKGDKSDTIKKGAVLSTEIEERMRKFANLLLDKIIDDYNNGHLKNTAKLNSISIRT